MAPDKKKEQLSEKEIQEVFELLGLGTEEERRRYLLESQKCESQDAQYIMGVSDSSVPAPLWGYKDAKLERNT